MKEDKIMHYARMKNGEIENGVAHVYMADDACFLWLDYGYIFFPYFSGDGVAVNDTLAVGSSEKTALETLADAIEKRVDALEKERKELERVAGELRRKANSSPAHEIISSAQAQQGKS